MTETYPEWLWEAYYTDGSSIKQADGYKFADIDQNRLHAFVMTNPSYAPFVIRWREGLKLIHFYRTRFTIGESCSKIRMTCFGYQEGSSKTILALMPDGGVIITDNVDGIVIET